jgi:SAM-dependent methyltransferase
MMWLLKALVQKGLAALPQSEQWNSFFQRRITRSLPVEKADFLDSFRLAVEQYRAFQRFRHGGRPEPVFYEFGAGWDLRIPLAYFILGVKHQVVTDIRPKLRLDLVNSSIIQYAGLHPELEDIAGRPLPAMPPYTLSAAPEIKNIFGIDYRAPFDPRHTGFAAAEFDFVSATRTLEHIPGPDLDLVLPECKRLLVPGGVAAFYINLEDNFADFDRSIGIYNFLKFSPRAWTVITSPLNYQNRLRYPDYIRVFTEGGFIIRQQSVGKANAKETETLQQMRVYHPFRVRYTAEELGVKTLKVAVTAG